tara:strand:- start:2447 stop:2689 length:243 start_codon:yes stop_codon:yes gene_type:complete
MAIVVGTIVGIGALKCAALGGIVIADAVDREICELRESGRNDPNSVWRKAFLCSKIGDGKRREAIMSLLKPKKRYNIRPS